MKQNHLNQSHLNKEERINQGSYYTNPFYIDFVYRLISPHINDRSIIVDSSCGYGGFLRPQTPQHKIGCDIDAQAIEVAKANGIQAEFKVDNALKNVSRKQYGLKDEDSICIIGNPPYNDTKSIIRNGIKRLGGDMTKDMDWDIATRDLGFSFLLSYNKLKADVVCVLHPLSYLIKPTNFNIIRQFTHNYKLTEGVIISSGRFAQNSAKTHFPILIALYIRDKSGTNYQQIKEFRFKIGKNKTFSLNDFDYIDNYLDKYPSNNGNYSSAASSISASLPLSATPTKKAPMFWTQRDINALKRNRTFVDRPGPNVIMIKPQQLEYYIYVDVFKRFSERVPYYFGNCNVMIDNELFKQYRSYFLNYGMIHNPFLCEHLPDYDKPIFSEVECQEKIDEYFKELLGEHYVDE